MNRFIRSICYVPMALLMLALALWIAAPLYAGEDMVPAYLRSELLLFSAACGMIGVGAYTYFAYTRRHREYRWDSRFFLLFGVLLLLIEGVVLVRFGGMDTENFGEGSYPAINLNLMLAGVLPLPVLVRGFCTVSAVPREDARRRVAAVLLLAVAAGYVVAVLTGHLLHTVTAAM